LKIVEKRKIIVLKLTTVIDQFASVLLLLFFSIILTLNHAPNISLSFFAEGEGGHYP